MFDEDGKTRIIEANEANGLTITIINVPALVDKVLNVAVTETNASATAAPQTRQAAPAPVRQHNIEVNRGCTSHGFSRSVRYATAQATRIGL